MSDQTPSRASTRTRVPSSKKIQSDEYQKDAMKDVEEEAGEEEEEEEEEEEVVVPAKPAGKKGSRAARIPDSDSEDDKEEGDGDHDVGDNGEVKRKGTDGNETSEQANDSGDAVEEEDDDDVPLASKVPPPTQVKKGKSTASARNASAQDKSGEKRAKSVKSTSNSKNKRAVQEQIRDHPATDDPHRDENVLGANVDTGGGEDTARARAEGANNDQKDESPARSDDGDERYWSTKAATATPPPSSPPSSPVKTPKKVANRRMKSGSERKKAEMLLDVEAEEDNDDIETDDAEEGYDEHVRQTKARKTGQQMASQPKEERHDNDGDDVRMDDSLPVRALPTHDVPMSDEEDQQEENIVFSHGGSAAAREYLGSFHFDDSDPAYARVKSDAIFQWSGICNYAFSIGGTVGTYAVVDTEPPENVVSYIKQDRVMERSYPATDIMEIFCFAVAFFQGSDLVNLSRISWRSIDFVKVSDRLLSVAFLDKDGKDGIGASGARRGVLVTLLEAEAFRLFACLNRLGKMGETNSFKFPLYADGMVGFTTKVVSKDGARTGGNGPTLISAKGGWQPKRKIGVFEFNDKIPVLDGQGRKDLWKGAELGVADVLGLPSYNVDKLVPEQMVSVLYTITRWKRKTEKAAENLSFNIAALVVLSGPIDRVAAQARLVAPRVHPATSGGTPRTGKVSVKINDASAGATTSKGRGEGSGSAKRAAGGASGSPPKKAKKDHTE
ncbi:uncharacterized protein SCHCODRAFT_02497615 [Schizophyllum commune H4-8]|uniref:uncharacterized protein n=1 Tax=Schizophyllum commune (strain H4-8 / FGSC 9210) TaxID=578458 RepID=UPI00215FD306|nr:uncharacterized protein SCHCODRAFT_02497615 [Schizophyllum commune H4-8]KAI5895179.1 hypothetical protein SCHCODRAFT_02497615 [Schizophyllum commune H4-8]